MLKLVHCITKKPEMTGEAFFHYWEDIHGPIGARVPGLRRLIQSHRVCVPGDARDADFDGMAEWWFDDIEALLEARRSQPASGSQAAFDWRFIRRAVSLKIREERTCQNTWELSPVAPKVPRYAIEPYARKRPT
jgi:uncharacterized protein (TIGR02118 family)